MTMIQDIWRSFRSMPLWVQVWAVGILFPVNLLTVLFLDQPYGVAVAALAVAGLVGNAVLMIVQCGFSKSMAVPHVVFWVPLMLLLVWIMASGAALSPIFAAYLGMLLSLDALSLVFDIRDARDWWRGDREVFGRADRR